MKRYTKAEQAEWKAEFDNKIEFAAENILNDWYSFDYETVIEYKHLLEYPKEETRRIPIKIKLFVLNLRLTRKPELYNFDFDSTTRRFIRNHLAYRNEMGPIIGWDNAPFISSRIQQFVDVFKIRSYSQSGINSHIIGEAQRIKEPILLLFNKRIANDGAKRSGIVCSDLLDRIKSNMGDLKSKHTHKWDEAFDFKEFYTSQQYYSHPDYRYCDFIVLTSNLDADTINYICSALVGRNSQKLNERHWQEPIYHNFLNYNNKPHSQCCSMIGGCYHIPNFTIITLDYDITPEELYKLIEANLEQKGKLHIQTERENSILRLHREQVAEVARKRDAEHEAKRREEERRKFNQRNSHHRDTDIRFDNQTQQYTCSNQTLDNLKFFISTLFPNFDKTKYLERGKRETNQDYDTILKQWREKAEKTKQQERELRSNIDYWFRTGHVLSDRSFVLFKEFANNQGIFPFRTNWHIYDLDTRIAGSVDLATQNIDGALILYALTTRSHIIDNGLPIKNNEDDITAKEPISNIPDTLYYRFAMELNMLKYILEKHYGYTVRELRLGVFNKSNSKPYILRMPILKSETDKLIELRSDIIF